MTCTSCGDPNWDEKCYHCCVECADCGLTIDGDLRSGCPSCGSHEQNAEYTREGVYLL